MLKLWGIYSDTNTDRQLESVGSIIITSKKEKNYIQIIFV